MSKIFATDHFEPENWEVSFEDLAPNFADLIEAVKPLKKELNEMQS